MKKLMSFVCKLMGFLCKPSILLVSWFTCICEWIYPLVAIFLRLWMLAVFFSSGLLKIQAWQNTLFLFEHEFKVTWLPLPPFIAEYFSIEAASFSPVLAACSGTAVELIIPCLLFAGIGGRVPAFILFVFNYIALVSYPFLWTDAGTSGYLQHIAWGAVLALLMFKGSGFISLDFLMKKQFNNYRY